MATADTAVTVSSVVTAYTVGTVVTACYAARRSPLRGKAGEPVSASMGPDRTAALIHYAIGDSAPTLGVGPHHTREPPGSGTIRVHSP